MDPTLGGAAGSVAPSAPTTPTGAAGNAATLPTTPADGVTPPGVPAAGAPGTVPSGGPAVPPGTDPNVPPTDATPTDPTASGEVTYHKDIRPIIEARCTACHVAGGVKESLPFTTWEGVEPAKGLIVNAVKTRRMPPWLADDTNCTKTRDSQRLTDEQLALFTTWETNGYPVGNEADFMPLQEKPQRTVTTEPDILIKARAAHRLTAGREYYACEATDASFAQDTWVYAMDLVPDNPEYVHHAIVNMGGAGNCDALGLTSENVYSYRPGSRTLVFEEGDAILFPAGTSISIQFHYNTMFAKAGEALPSDHSTYRLWTLPAGELPQRKIAREPNHDLSLNIPVGAVNQREGNTQSIGSEFTGGGTEIIGISPHMHYLGQSFKETVTIGGQEHCLVDIPKWDQAWQLDYLFEPEHYIKVTGRGTLDQVCVYSNRPEDQGKDPSGMPFTPQYTTFGEDTRQEMCLGYIWYRTPISGAR